MRGQPNDLVDKSYMRRSSIDTRYDALLQKYNENVKLTEELLQRIVVLEDKTERCVACRIITKVHKKV